MEALLWVVLGFVQMLLLLTASVQLSNYELSDYSLKKQFGRKDDLYSRSRVALYHSFREVTALRWLGLIIFGTISAVLFWQLNQPLGALLVIAGSFIIIAILSRIELVQSWSSLLFESLIDVNVWLGRLLKPLWWLVGLPIRRAVSQPTSRAEFIDQLQRLPSTVLPPHDRQQLESLLAARDKTVKDVMTPKSRVIAVDPKATLGPIVLSDLEKSGHGYFPVKTKKGQLEGILYLGDVADIHSAKQHQTVSELMKLYVAWIKDTASLDDLARAFVTEKQYIILVKDEAGEFSGLVTVADLLKYIIAIVKD